MAEVSEGGSKELGLISDETASKESSQEIPYSKSNFLQQRIPACRPFMSPCSGAIVYAVFAAISLLFGLIYLFGSKDMTEIRIPYDDCEETCTKSFTPEKNLTGPFYIYYEIDKMYQNHFLYGSSLNWPQLTGARFSGLKKLDSCKPQVHNENNQAFVPCGAVARSVFNDTYDFSNVFEVSSEGISLSTYKKKFKAADKSYDSEDHWMNTSLFPNDQTDERFINWMQIAPFPKFRKLWAKTDKGVNLKEGQTYSITITDNYPVSGFNGKKAIIIAQVGWTGGSNQFFGIFFLVLCGISGFFAIVFVVLYFTHALPLYRELRITTHELSAL